MSSEGLHVPYEKLSRRTREQLTDYLFKKGSITGHEEEASDKHGF